MTAPAAAATVPAAAIADLLSAIHAALPEATGHEPITGADMVRCVTGTILRRGVDEVTLCGAAHLLSEAAPITEPAEVAR